MVEALETQRVQGHLMGAKTPKGTPLRQNVPSAGYDETLATMIR